MPFRRCIFRFLNHFYVFQCWSAAVNVPHEYSLFKILFYGSVQVLTYDQLDSFNLFACWWSASHHKLYHSIFQNWTSVFLLFHACDSSGYWTMTAGWQFQRLWVLGIYPVFTLHAHRIGPVILLVLIIITVFLINCFFCSFQKLIVELYKEVRLKSSSISLSLGCFKADASFSSAHIFV